MRATAKPIEGSRVRLSVEVDAVEVDRVLDETVRKLSRQTRVPGFRPGKVPRRVLEARLGGATALRGEALRQALPDFYARAVTDAAVDAQIDRLREQEGELVAVDRPVIDKDNVTINLHGTAPDGSEVVGVDDLLYEVGSEAVTPELDRVLRGAKVGDVLTFHAPAPRMRGDREETLDVAYRVLVKQVQEKHLPDLTDAWAAASSEFQTVEELRVDIRQRLERMKIVQAQLALRENALGALVDLVDDGEVPEVLVEDELAERLHHFGHQLEEQKISFEQVLAASGKTAEEFVADVRVQAARAVKADLALRALASAEGIEVGDEEVDAEVEAVADRLNISVNRVRRQLERDGRIAAVRSERRKAKALAWLLDHVELVDPEGNAVPRERLRIDQSKESAEEAAERTEPEPQSREQSSLGRPETSEEPVAVQVNADQTVEEGIE